MRKNILTFILACLTAAGMAQGLVFEPLTLAEACAKAAAEHKLVFVDCYTVWCGPCKEMAGKEFPKKEAGDYFGPRFVCVKFDMERGEGKQVAARYDACVYPTFLILDAQGKELHRIVGSAPLTTFIDKVRTALGEPTVMETLDAQYAAGAMDKAATAEYVYALYGVKRDKQASETAEKLIGTLTRDEQLSPRYWPLMSGKYGYRRAAPEFVIANRGPLRGSVGAAEVDAWIASYFAGSLSPYLYGDRPDWADFETLKARVAAVDFRGKDGVDLRIGMAEARRAKDAARLTALLARAPGVIEEKDLPMITQLPKYLLDEGTHEQLAAIAALEEDFAAAMEDSTRQAYMRIVFAPYVRQSHTGVYFDPSRTFDEVLFMARAEQKPVLVDCHTRWCGPCRAMERDVFPLEEVGDYINRRFICIERDLDRGEGTALGRRYGVTALPTFLLLDVFGNASFKAAGGMSPEQFIATMKAGLDSMKAFEAMRVHYRDGERDEEFLRRFAKASFEAGSKDTPAVAAALLPLLDDAEKCSEEFWYLFGNDLTAPAGSDNAAYLAARRDAFRASVGAEKVDMRLSMPYYDLFMPLFSGGEFTMTREELAEARCRLESYGLTDRTAISYASLAEAMAFGDVKRVLAVCEAEFPRMEAGCVPLAVLDKRYRPQMNAGQLVRWKRIAAGVIARIPDGRHRKTLEEQLGF